jgi:hypothetical protein
MVGFYQGDAADFSAPEQQQGTSLLPTTTDQVTGQTLASDIRGSLVYRGAQWAKEELDPGQTLSGADATAKYGIPGVLKFDGPTSEATASDLYDRHHAELIQQDIAQRAPGGILTGSAVQGGIGLVGDLYDPTNLAAAMIPGVGEVRFAGLLGDSALGQLGAKAAAGAATGGIAMAAMEPLNYALSKHEQEDWTMAGALRNIAFGSLIGGGAHVLPALLGRDTDAAADPATHDEAVAASPVSQTMEAATPQAREQVFRAGLAQTLDDLPVDVGPAMDVAQAQTDAAAAPPPAAPTGESLLSFLTRKGGVNDPGGDLAAMDAGKARVGLLRKNGGMTLDDARSAAEQAGYLQDGSDTNSLLDAIDAELRGQKQFADAGANDAYRQRQEYEATAQREAASAEGAYHAVQEIDDQLDTPLDGEDLEHAAALVQQGMHPEEAVYEASRAATMRALGIEGDPVQRQVEAFRDAHAVIRDQHPPQTATARAAEEAGARSATSDDLDTINQQIADLETLYRQPESAQPKPAGHDDDSFPGDEPPADPEMEAAQSGVDLAEQHASAMEQAGICLSRSGL